MLYILTTYDVIKKKILYLITDQSKFACLFINEIKQLYEIKYNGLKKKIFLIPDIEKFSKYTILTYRPQYNNSKNKPLFNLVRIKNYNMQTEVD